jgi:hypothetical protein
MSFGRVLFQRQPVARLLVRPVTEVLRFREDLRVRQGLRDRGRFVVARVIDHDGQVDDLLREDLLMRLPQGPGRVVCGHDHDDLLTLEHPRRSY